MAGDRSSRGRPGTDESRRRPPDVFPTGFQATRGPGGARSRALSVLRSSQSFDVRPQPEGVPSMLPLVSALPLFLSREVRHLLKVALPLLAIGLVAASPAAAKSGGDAPKAHASGGGGGALLYPSIVNRRLVRGEKALDRANDYVDRDMPDKAITSLLNARRNMYAAWRGAKYLIDHAPPAPVESGSVRRARSGTVHMSG